MFDKFINENWEYIRYKRKDKVHLNTNDSIIKRLEAKLNQDVIITEIIKNPALPNQMHLAPHESAITQILLSNALIYSNNTPINIDLFNNIKVSSFTPFYGRDTEILNFGLQLKYFSSADKTDIEFIHKCLKETRFKEYVKG